MRNFNLHSRTENVFTEAELRDVILSAFRKISPADLRTDVNGQSVETELNFACVTIIGRCVRVSDDEYCVSIRYKVDGAMLAVAFLDTSDL